MVDRWVYDLGVTGGYDSWVQVTGGYDLGVSGSDRWV